MIERVPELVAECAVRVIGTGACGRAIARLKYGELGHFAVYAIGDDDDEDDGGDGDEEPEPEPDPDIWGKWVRDDGR